MVLRLDRNADAGMEIKFSNFIFIPAGYNFDYQLITYPDEEVLYV